MDAIFSIQIDIFDMLIHEVLSSTAQALDLLGIEKYSNRFYL